MKTKSIIACALLLMVGGLSGFGQWDPLGYWQFNAGSMEVDNGPSGPADNLLTNQGSLNPGNNLPIVGQYHHATTAQGLTPGTQVDMDLGSQNLELTLEFWFRSTPGMRLSSVYWDNKCQFEIADNHIWWIVTLNNGDERELLISLSGVGPGDGHNLLDGEWHHLVGQYNACSGEQKVYIDGVCPPGFLIHHPVNNQPTVPIADGGSFHLSWPGGVNGVNLMEADLDEMAVYDRIIPPNLIWQHYNEALTIGAHYTFTLQPQYTNFVPPFPQPTTQGGVNLLEFAPGYPSVSQIPKELFDHYPLPRYTPNERIRRLVPFDSDPLPYEYGTNAALSNANAKDIFNTLARDWNYYLFGGDARTNWLHSNPTDIVNPNFYAHHVVDAFNDPANANLPRFMTNNWYHVNNMESGLGTFNGNYATLGRPQLHFPTPPNLPNSYYIGDGSSNPILLSFNVYRLNYSMGANPLSPLMIDLGRDGQTSMFYMHEFMNNPTRPIVDKHLELIAENDETMSIENWDDVDDDPAISLDALNSNLTGRPYMSTRRHQMNLAYRMPILDGVDAMNGSQRPPVEYWWYNNRGEQDIYEFGRQICRFNDGRFRPGPYLYPQNPSRWRHGTNAFLGLDAISNSRVFELVAGDQVFIPAISPGYNDGQATVKDDEMLRPGQFLGVLKGMAMMGAESFLLFEYNGNNTIAHDANWRIWKPTIPAYAQAIQGRLKNLLYNGEALVGDPFQGYNSGTDYFLNFTTGNDLDFVTARQGVLPNGNPNQFVISVSAQRMSNAPGNSPHVKEISFRLRENNGAVVYDPLTVESRLQGSVYFLDNTNPLQPIFYQLDRWHEWKEPSHWCRDFDFEAEVWDSMVVGGGVTIATERPIGAAAGDFSVFTSYVHYGATNDWLRYYFKPRHADQGSLYVWVRARNNGSTPADVLVSLDGGVATALQIPIGGWVWVGRNSMNQSVLFPQLGSSSHYLQVQVSSTDIEIDQVTLKRSPDDFSSQAFSVTATGQDVCLGDPTNFTGAVTQPAGCVDLVWDFGDGTRAYERNPIHTYQYPGIYTVTLTATHQCLGSTASATITVHVNAPYVEAGPDKLVCMGSTTHFQAHLVGATNSVWSVDPLATPLNVNTLTFTIVTNPAVTPGESGYYYFTADSGGCSMTDSVYVTVLPALNVSDTPDQTICTGQQLQLQVNGAAFVWWTPEPSLSSTTVANPVATPTGTVSYEWFATNICRCDTITGTITLTMVGGPQAACQNTTVALGANGNVIVPPQAVDGGSIYGCILGNLGLVPDAFTCARIGANPVIFTVTDLLGNTSSCSAVVTIEDQTPPLAVCQNVTVTLGTNGTAALLPTAVNGGSADVCSPVTLSINPSTLDCSHYPITTVALTATDASGNSSTCTATATVIGNLSLQTDIIWDCIHGEGSFEVLSPTGPGIIYSLFNLSGGLISQGTGTVQPPTPVTVAPGPYNMIVNGNNVCGTSQVTMGQPTLPFTVTVTGSSINGCQPNAGTITVTVVGAGTFTYQLYDANFMPYGGSQSNGNFTGLPLGFYYVTVTSDLDPTQCAHDYGQVLLSTITPVASAGGGNGSPNTACTAPYNGTAYIYIRGGNLANVMVTITDFGTGQLVYSGTLYGTGSPFTVSGQNVPGTGTPHLISGLNGGTYVINVITPPLLSGCATVTVTVGQSVSPDITPPTALCQDITIQVPTSGPVTIQAGDIDNGSNDACGLQGLGISASSFNCDLTGVQAVVLTATDLSGNTATCSANVTVDGGNICCLPPQVAGNRFYRDATAAQIRADFAFNGGVVNQNIAISGTLRVDFPGLVIDNATAYMAAGARIEVDVLATFTLQNQASLQAGCGEMWDGIYISDPNAMVVVDHSTVMDAINGIVSTNGGNFRVEVGHFENNWWSMRVTDFVGQHPGEVKQSVFLGNGPLLPPYDNEPRPMGGIYVRNVERFTVGHVMTPPQGGYNHFADLGVGIHSENCNLGVFRNKFFDMKERQGDLSTGCGVYSTTYNLSRNNPELVVGSQSGTSLQDLEDSENWFDGCERGVFVDNGQDVWFRGNIVRRIGSAGFFSRQQVNSLTTVETNTFYENFVGVFIGHATENFGVIRGNTFTSPDLTARRGVQLELLTYPSLNADPTLYGMEVLENDMDLTGAGVFVQSSERVNVDGNDIFLIPNGYQHSEGVFLNSNAMVRVANNVIWSDADGRRDESVSGVYVHESPQSFVICNELHDLGRCAVWEGISTPSDFLSNTMRDGVQGLVWWNDGEFGDQGTQNNPSDNKWQGAFTGFQTLASSSDAEAFDFWCRTTANYWPTANGGIGLGFVPLTPEPVINNNVPATISCTKRDGSGDTERAIADLVSQPQPSGDEEAAAKARAEEWAYTAVLKDSSLMQNDTTISGFVADQEDGTLEGTVTAAQTLSEQDTTASQAQVSQIVPSALMEANHQTVLLIRQDGKDLDSVELSQLEEIAGQCQLLGGKAVNIARSILAAEGRLIWEDPSCSGTKRWNDAGSQPAGASVMASCWPNPASSRVFVRLEDKAASGVLRVFDAQGKSLLVRSIERGGREMELHASGWASGLVLVVVEVADGSRFEWKVFIER